MQGYYMSICVRLFFPLLLACCHVQDTHSSIDCSLNIVLARLSRKMWTTRARLAMLQIRELQEIAVSSFRKYIISVLTKFSSVENQIPNKPLE